MVVVAPETEQSAVGHAITIYKPLKVREISNQGEFFGYAVKGTPADCVKIALTSLLKDTPELVISGINHGGNVATCVIYSGTVSAAIEAAMMGVPAMAVSLNTWEPPEFSAAAVFIRRFAPMVLEKGLPEGVSLNVNVPPVPDSKIKGVVVTRQGKSRVIETFDRRVDPRNNVYYWMAGEMHLDDTDKNTDCARVHDDYISITPIHYDLTHLKTLEEMKNWDIRF